MLTKLLVLAEHLLSSDIKVSVYAVQRNGHAGSVCNVCIGQYNMHKYFRTTTIWNKYAINYNGMIQRMRVK